MTRCIYGLSDIAIEEREHATMAFLKWFIDEQVEEESTFNTLIAKISRIQNDSNAIFHARRRTGNTHIYTTSG